MEPMLTKACKCPLCNEDHNVPFAFEEVRLAHSIVSLGINRCRLCGLVYVSPRLNEEGLNFLYSTMYATQTVSGVCIDPEVSEAEYKRFYDYAVQLCPHGGRLLDVGCGVGNFLELLRRKSQFELTGVEYSLFAAQEALEKGCRILEGDLRDLALPAESYELISMLYVLEHAADPVGLLKEVARLLKLEGYALIAVPNYNYLRMVYTGPICRILFGTKTRLHAEEHLQNFTPRTLELAIRQTNLQLVQWGCAAPLRLGSLPVRVVKTALSLGVKVLFKVRVHLGGIHLIVKKTSGNPGMLSSHQPDQDNQCGGCSA